VLMSHSLIVKSPEAEARIFSAAGLKRTCPTFLKRGQLGPPLVYAHAVRKESRTLNGPSAWRMG